MLDPAIDDSRPSIPCPTARRLGSAVLACLLPAAPLTAEVPTYEVDVVSTFTVATTLRGASDAGHLVGDQTVLGLLQPFLATAESGLQLLPLPDGFQSGTALDVNDGGVIVGAVADNGFPFDAGEPAIWLPDGAGGHDVVIPEQFDALSSPIGELTIDGGMAVAINDAGTIVGWSRYAGFQGGPSTRFFVDGAPVDLRGFGFEATVRDVSDHDLVVGGRLKLDLATGTTTDIGLPDPIPGGTPFVQAIIYRVNASGETVVAADLASIPLENWLTYLHDDVDGWTRLNESQLPTPFVGFYDNNDLGDVSASGGVLFRAEDVLLPDFDDLLAPGSRQWDPALGFIANDRSVATTAVNAATGDSALVILRPQADAACHADLDGSGVVDLDDLVTVLAAWGSAEADVDGDGVTGFGDAVAVLSAWGPCPG